jgi:hypothetical protein
VLPLTHVATLIGTRRASISGLRAHPRLRRLWLPHGDAAAGTGRQARSCSGVAAAYSAAREYRRLHQRAGEPGGISAAGAGAHSCAAKRQGGGERAQGGLLQLAQGTDHAAAQLWPWPWLWRQQRTQAGAGDLRRRWASRPQLPALLDQPARLPPPATPVCSRTIRQLQALAARTACSDPLLAAAPCRPGGQGQGRHARARALWRRPGAGQRRRPGRRGPGHRPECALLRHRQR